MPYSVYILECKNGSYYTGYTTDLDRRYKAHINGTSKCKYTRSFPPKHIVASVDCGDDLSRALKLENYIKRLSKAEKQLYIDGLSK